MEKYRSRRADQPAGSRRVRLAVLLFPTDRPKRET
jgi:hypothetical protein